MEGAIGGAIYGNLAPAGGAAAAAAPAAPAQAPQPNHPHYENIYAPIGQPSNNNNNSGSNSNQAAAIANANAPANAEEIQQQQQPAPTEPNANNNPQPPTAAAPAPSQQQQQQQAQPQQPQRILPMNNYRNDLYDRSAAGGVCSAYDVPRAVRSGLGYRRNFRIDMQNGNRCGSGLRCTPLYTNSRSNCQRQRSFDDTESTDGYNLPYAGAGTMRYENIYEQIRDEPLYRTSAANRVPLYTRLDVLGHGIGRIERHLSSSCGNIDHYNLGGHYAVLGHSHFGTVGHIRLNANGSGVAAPGVAGTGTCNVPNCQGYMTAAGSTVPVEYANVKVPVKNSASSFFSCLHGENSQSMTNIYKTSGTAAAMAAHNSPLTPNVSMERASRSASAGAAGSAAAAVEEHSAADSIPSSSNINANRTTGAIPKVKTANKPAKESGGSSTAASPILDKTTSTGSGKSVTLAKKTSTAAARSSSSGDTNGNGTLNRISKSSLQWLLVNKWLPLWIGQGPDCKVIDFNFMFSRDCVSCDTASVASQMSNPYGTPRLSGLPQDMVRFQSSCAGACAAAGAASTIRRDANASARPLHSTLSRLRNGEKRNPNRVAGNYQYEDPSYENVHVQWQNGFEFGRSRDYDPNSTYHQQRPLLQRARSESPTFSNQQRRLQRQGAQAQQQSQQPKPPGSPDPYKNYKLNADNNTFKPKPIAADELEGAVGGAVAEIALPEVDIEVVDPVSLSDNETETTSSQNNLPSTTNSNNLNEHND